MELDDLLKQVNGPESFLEFVKALIADRYGEAGKTIDPCGRGANGWENHTIESFLEAAVAWAEDSNMGSTQGLGEASPWYRCAMFLMCGKIYE